MFREYRNVTPYRFNGKELDTETGLYYYGARYYNPSTALWLGVDPLASKYPGVSPYAFCFSNPINFIDLNGKEATEREASILSSHVYGDKVELEGGEECQDILEGITLIDDESGFKSKLYMRNLADGGIEYTYAFAGTDMKEFNDWENNIQQVIGLSEQYSIAEKNALSLQKKFGNSLSFTGHSLGGGMAAYASAITGLSAKTFNAAVVSFSTHKSIFPLFKFRNVNAYVNIGDELRLLIGNPNGILHFRFNRSSIMGHSIKNFYKPGIIEKTINWMTNIFQKIFK